MSLAAIRIGALAFAVLVPGASTLAQKDPPPPRRGWVTAGIGMSSGRVRGFAVTGGGSYSHGAAIVSARADAMGQWFGDGTNDKALLGGLRTRGNSWFAVAVAGIARTHSFNTYDDGTSEARATVLAFEVKGFHAFEVTSSSLSIYGTLGPRPHRHMAVTLSRDFGWFGPSR